MLTVKDFLEQGYTFEIGDQYLSAKRTPIDIDTEKCKEVVNFPCEGDDQRIVSRSVQISKAGKGKLLKDLNTPIDWRSLKFLFIEFCILMTIVCLGLMNYGQ